MGTNYNFSIANIKSFEEISAINFKPETDTNTANALVTIKVNKHYKDEDFILLEDVDYKHCGSIYFKEREDARYIIDNFKEELMEYWL